MTISFKQSFNHPTCCKSKIYFFCFQRAESLVSLYFCFFFLLKSEPELPWEVSFDTISNPEWLGSGAQGVVFRGQFRGEVIAFKKVNKKADTEIRHLRSLRHPNIVQFK